MSTPTTPLRSEALSPDCSTRSGSPLSLRGSPVVGTPPSPSKLAGKPCLQKLNDIFMSKKDSQNSLLAQTDQSVQLNMWKLMESLQREASDTLTELDSQRQDAQGETLEALRQLNHNQREMRALKESIENLKASSAEVEAKRQETFLELEEVKKQLDSTQTSVQGTQKQLEAKIQELKDKEKALTEAADKIRNQTEVINEGLSKHEKLEKSHLSMQQEMGTKLVQIDDLKERLEDSTAEVKKIRDSFEKLQKLFEERGVQLDERNRLWTELNQKSDTFTTTIASLAKENQKLMADILEKERTIDQLRQAKVTTSPSIPTQALRPPPASDEDKKVTPSTPATSETEKDEIIKKQIKMIGTLKKVACVVLALLIVVSLGLAVYFLFPQLIASGVSVLTQVWKSIVALAAKNTAVPANPINPVIYALRGRLGV